MGNGIIHTENGDNRKRVRVVVVQRFATMMDFLVPLGVLPEVLVEPVSCPVVVFRVWLFILRYLRRGHYRLSWRLTS